MVNLCTIWSYDSWIYMYFTNVTGAYRHYGMHPHPHPENDACSKASKFKYTQLRIDINY